MSNAVAAVDTVVQKVEQYALVLVGGGIAAFTAADPSTLPHKWGASLLVANGILITIKPYLQKALTVTQAFNAKGVEQTVATVVDRVTGDVKHVVADVQADAKQVVVAAEDGVTVVKDEVHQVPAPVQTEADAKAVADATAARNALEAQAKQLQTALAAAEAQLNAAPPTPGGPSGV